MKYLKVLFVFLLLICCAMNVFATSGSSEEQEEMGVVGKSVMLIMALVFGGIFWVLYHKCFDVVYWGSGCSGVIKEWIVCFLLGAIPAAIIYKIGFFLLKWILIIGGVVFVIGLIIALCGKISEKKEEKSEIKTSEEKR